MRKKRNKKLKVSVSLPRLSALEFSNADKFEEAVGFYLTKLGVSKRLQNTLSVKVHIRKTTLGKSTLGTCNIPLNGSKSTKDFKIVLLWDLPFYSQLSTLAHECAHIAQQVSGRLQLRRWSSDGKEHVRWEGKDLGEYLVDVSYEDAPWEKEAHAFGKKAYFNIFKKWRA
tara:strand:+ start:54 stop:563 length:510 start_codon:yes stop_codon:yes gene_type:complete